MTAEKEDLARVVDRALDDLVQERDDLRVKVAELVKAGLDLDVLRVERDAAHAEAEQWRQDSAETHAQLDRCEHERDEARAELEQFINGGGHAAWDTVSARDDEIVSLKAEVERLRAAQPVLPDVGTPIRHANGALEVPVNPGDWTMSRHYENRKHAAEAAACALAALRQFDRLDAEKADTTTDGAAVRHAVASVESFIADHDEFSTADVVRVAARAALQHRSRAGAGDGRE